MQIHPGGHAHVGPVDRRRVLSIAPARSLGLCRVAEATTGQFCSQRVQSTCQSHMVQSRGSDDRPALLPEGAVHMPITQGWFVCGVHD